MGRPSYILTKSRFVKAVNSKRNDANLLGSNMLETSRHSVAIGGAAAAVVAVAAEPSPIMAVASGARPDVAPSPSPAVIPRPAAVVGSMPIPGTVLIPMFAAPTAGVIGTPSDIPE